MVSCQVETGGSAHIRRHVEVLRRFDLVSYTGGRDSGGVWGGLGVGEGVQAGTLFTFFPLRRWRVFVAAGPVQKTPATVFSSASSLNTRAGKPTVH